MWVNFKIISVGVEVASTPSVPKIEQGGGNRLATRVITRPMAINAGKAASITLTRPVV